MNCIAYARVSTGAQADRQLSIPAQLAAMREYSAREGWQIVEEYLEAGMSGRTSSRPELTRMLNRCKSGDIKIDVLLVHKLDRLTRNLSDHLTIRAFLAKQKVRVVSVTERVDDSVSGQLLEHLMASIAEFYSANLAEEVRKGLTQRIKQGGWPHLHPFGYVRLGVAGEAARPVVPDPKLQPFIRQVFETVSTGEYRFTELADWLKGQGVTLPVESIRRMLRNPFYCGRLRWKEQLLEGNHPAIVSPALFDRVQQVLAQHRRPYERPERRLLLQAFASCASCSALVGSECHERYAYYRCRGTFRKSRTCHAKAMSATFVHRDLERIYQETPVTSEILERLGQLEATRRRSAEQDLTWQKAKIEQQLEQHRIRQLRLAESLASGDLDPDLYRLALQKLKTERSHVPSALAPLQLSDADTLAVLNQQLDSVRQRLLLESVFTELMIDGTGVVRYTFASAA